MMLNQDSETLKPPQEVTNMNNPLLIPMFSHMILTASLYVLLTVMRAPSVWKIGARDDGSNPFNDIEKRTSANLSNQFEWPLFFHIVCVILIIAEIQPTDVFQWLAWLFIAGRILHSYIHIFTTNIRLRGVVFTINFLAVVTMWLILLINQ